MLICTFIREFALSGFLMVTAASAFPAFAQCCPGDGNGVPRSLSGLGHEHPVAIDQSFDPNWRVYQFQRAGINYIQVNDRNGVVRAAVGSIDELIWVMPIGVDADRVQVARDEEQFGYGTLLYRDDAVELLRSPDASGGRWVFRVPDSKTGRMSPIPIVR